MFKFLKFTQDRNIALLKLIPKMKVARSYVTKLRHELTENA